MATPRTGVVLDVPIGRLHPHERNPRKITPSRMEQLKASLEAEAEMMNARPLIALPDGTVIAGNHRLLAARELGWTKIKVVYADLDEERAIEWMLRDNQGYADEVDDQVASLLAELNAAGRDLALTGFDSSDLDRLLKSTSVKDPDDAPPLPPDPKSKAGEIYELGPHLLACGDSTDPVLVERLFSQPQHHALDLIELIWTDPPYGVNYVGKTKDALTIENDQKEGLRGLIAGALGAVQAGLAPHARFYITGPSSTHTDSFTGAIRDVGWRLHQILVWQKQRLVLGHSDYHYQHELIFYGWAARAEWEGRPGRGKHRGTCWYGGNDQTSVFAIDAPTRSADHPTMKPVQLIEAHLVNSTQRGAIVYDPFGGSGSSLLACEMTSRRARLVELDPGYCDVIRRRYADYVGRPELAP